MTLPTPMGAVYLYGQAEFHDDILSLPSGLSHPKGEQLECAAAYFGGERRPSPGLNSLLSISCMQALLMNIPWWDKHVSNKATWLP